MPAPKDFKPIAPLATLITRSAALAAQPPARPSMVALEGAPQSIGEVAAGFAGCVTVYPAALEAPPVARRPTGSGERAPARHRRSGLCRSFAAGEADAEEVAMTRVVGLKVASSQRAAVAANASRRWMLAAFDTAHGWKMDEWIALFPHVERSFCVWPRLFARRRIGDRHCSGSGHR